MIIEGNTHTQSDSLIQSSNGVSQNLNIGLDLAGKPGQLFLPVQHLNPLGEGIVDQAEGALQGGSKLADLLLGILETVSHEIDGLVLGDGIFLAAGLERIKGL